MQANDCRLSGRLRFTLHLLLDLQDLALTDREGHIDWILAHHGGEGARFRAEQRALLVGGQSDTAINRRNDARVAKVDLSLQERSLGLQGCGFRRQLLGLTVVKIGLGDGLMREQFLSTIELHAGIVGGRFRGRDVGFLLLDLRLVRIGFDREQEIASLDVLPLGEMPLEQEA